MKLNADQQAEYEGFHAHIRESPDDPDLRLIFGDWLEQHGLDDLAGRQRRYVELLTPAAKHELSIIVDGPKGLAIRVRKGRFTASSFLYDNPAGTLIHDAQFEHYGQFHFRLPSEDAEYRVVARFGARESDMIFRKPEPGIPMTWSPHWNTASEGQRIEETFHRLRHQFRESPAPLAHPDIGRSIIHDSV